MRKSNTLLSVAIATAASILLILPGLVMAASTSGSGMKIAPVRTELTISPGESKTISIFVQNVTSGTENLKVIKNDFIANKDESGAPSLLLNGQANDKHGLKQYISTLDTITIPQGQQKEVKVTINIPVGTAGGGYYGAVRFAPSSSDASKNVSLSGSVGSLILVRVPGNATEKLTLASFNVTKGNASHTLFTSNKDLQVTARFQNQGNIQEIPFGKVILKKSGKAIGQYELNNNKEPGNVLPDSIRKFNVKLSNLGSFGKYTVEGNFGYGTNGQLLSAKTTFYIVPLAIIILGIVIILLILFLIIGLPKLLRRHDRQVLRKAGRR